MCFQFPVLLFEGKEIYLEDNEKMERNFEGFFFFFVFLEVLETLDTGFFNYVQFYSILVVYLFPVQFLSSLLLFHCDGFHCVNSQLEFRKGEG